MLKEITGSNLGITAKINGSVEINKNTKFVTTAIYDFKELLFATLSKGNENKKSYNITVDNFTLSSHLLSTPTNQMELEGPFTPYAISDKLTFVNNFKKYVVPSLEDVEVDGNGEPVDSK